VLIGGEAGIGKTRLANELALLANTQGGRTLRGTTSSPEQVPYQPIVEALRDALPLLTTVDVRPVWLAAVAAIVPELALRRTDLPLLPPIDAARERSRLMEGLAAVVQGLAQQRPLLVILEDLQWAGEATLFALEYLARRVAAFPALIVATYRNEAAKSHDPFKPCAANCSWKTSPIIFRLAAFRVLRYATSRAAFQVSQRTQTPSVRTCTPSAVAIRFLRSSCCVKARRPASGKHPRAFCRS
jgi:hypothetical protein